MRNPANLAQRFELSTTPSHAHLDPRLAYTALLVFAGYYLGAKVGLALTFQPNPISVLWPPNSILFAALLLTAVSAWWVVLMAALSAHLLAELQGGIPVSMVLCWFASNVCEALIGALFVRRLIDGPLTFNGLRNVLIFIATAIIATFVSSFLDSAFVMLNGWGTRSYRELWETRFFSNVVASLTLVPVIVTWASGGFATLRSAARGRVIEAGVLVVALIVTTVLVFDSSIGTGSAPALLYVPLPLLLWAALRFGPTGTSTSFAVVAFVVIWGAGHGMGPMGARSPEENAQSVQLFLIFVAPSLLLLAAVLEERKAAEKMSRETGERLGLALEAGRMGVWDLDTRTNAVTWSAEHFTILGIAPFTLQPTYSSWADRVHPDDLSHATTAMETAIAERTEYRCEYRIVLPEGAVRWVEALGKPLYDQNGECCRVMGLVVDITERRHADELNQRLAQSSRLTSMGELTASIAHEINQPMSAILSNVDAAEMLLDAGNAYGGELRRILDDIRSDDLRASEVVRHVRGMISTRQETQSFDLNGLIEAVLRLVAPIARQRKVAISSDFSELPPVWGDRIHVQQVLLNLLLNGMDAMAAVPEGRRLLSVKTKTSGRDSVEVAVRDGGTGISPEQINRIFDSFFTTKKDGMGLGLSIARSLVEIHGGKIWAENNGSEAGATFHFTLGLNAGKTIKKNE
jgi:PAS domain S-box-containing protein